MGENNYSLRNDRNKLGSHWLSLPLRWAIFGWWIIKLEANSNKQSFHFNNFPFSSKHAVILFNVVIIKYLQGEDLVIWLNVCTRTKCRSHRSEHKRPGKTKQMNIKHKNMLFEFSVICSEPSQDVRCNYVPRRSAQIVLSNFQLFEIQYSILFYREQKHSPRRIISNKMTYSAKMSPCDSQRPASNETHFPSLRIKKVT